RLRRGLAGMALPSHQTSRADDRGEAWHRRIARCAVPERVIVQTDLSRSVGDPAPDVSPSRTGTLPQMNTDFHGSEGTNLETRNPRAAIELGKQERRKKNPCGTPKR